MRKWCRLTCLQELINTATRWVYGWLRLATAYEEADIKPSQNLLLHSKTTLMPYKIQQLDKSMSNCFCKGTNLWNHHYWWNAQHSHPVSHYSDTWWHQCCHSVIRKNPRIYLKKIQKIKKENRHRKCQKSQNQTWNVRYWYFNIKVKVYALLHQTFNKLKYIFKAMDTELICLWILKLENLFIRHLWRNSNARQK